VACLGARDEQGSVIVDAQVITGLHAGRQDGLDTRDSPIVLLASAPSPLAASPTTYNNT
jgi:hypothetical protein